MFAQNNLISIWENINTNTFMQPICKKQWPHLKKQDSKILTYMKNNTRENQREKLIQNNYNDWTQNTDETTFLTHL